ncbi:EAL domain-containing protein [Lamprocystis purpurea]|uniref:EAL domain-containing protein n=1 Tax=Lamprocystis purpurea TaxID=61598 RepID=UPI00036F3A7D|nr:EAL domain-containing protein [Lamprocystis purpurea]
MTLRTRIRLLVLVCTLIALWLLGVFFAAYREKTRAEQDLALSESLTVATAQLRTMLFGHLVSPHTQPRSQVEAQFKRLTDLLQPGTQSSAASDAPDSDTRYAWNGARRMVSDLLELLADLDATGTDPRLSARGRQTTDLILMNSHAMTLFVSQIRDHALDGFFRASTREKHALGLLLAGLAAIGLGLLLLIERSLLLPIDRLRQAVLQIGGSATALRLKTHRRDELGQLAKAFDRLLDQIQETTVSRDRLAVEVDERARAERALQESQDWLHLAMQTSRSFAFDWDPQSDRARRSATCAAILGVTGETAAHDTGQDYVARVVPADRARFIALREALRPAADRYHTEYRITRGDGKTVVLEETAHGFFDAQGRLQRLVGAATDITERTQAAEALRQSEEQFRTLADAVPQIVWMTRPDGGNNYFNQQWVDYTGLTLEESYGDGWNIPFHPDDRQRAWDAWQHAVQTDGVYALECRLRRADGVYGWWLVRGASLHDADGHVVNWFGTCTDIQDLKDSEAQLERSAHYDGLTGLPNRVLLADRLHQEMVQAQRRARPVAVVLLDLDGFKTINDRHGHAAGDQFLIAVAARMRQALRAGDTFARLGGDEFVAVLPDLADTQDGVPLLARLLAAAAQPVAAGDRVLQASASLGATFYPQAEDIDAEQLLRQADQAMYQAKLAGKNCYHVFDAEHDRTLRGHHEVLERIRRALVAHEFVLYYQPKVNMRTGAIIGAEALIRWQHPERGLLPPAAFLPVIEDHPLAIAIGEWVIDTALTQMECWQATGREFPVSVNVGARQLQQANFVERLRALLAAHPQVRPGHLELEVLETSALELAGASRVLDACRGFGVLSALDDFGTGFSSLTYLRRLPVAQLKIDQSFVRDMLVDPDDLAIIEAVLGLATAFQRQVIAEGVETVAQGELLLRLGCELAQGYAIARPMPAADLPGWSAAWQRDPAWIDLPTASRDDLPLLFAGVEHHAWMTALESHLKGDRAAPPPLDQRECRFGMWLDADGLASYGAQPAAAAIRPLHQQIHVLATAVCDLHTQDRTSEALTRLGELHDLQDALLEHLKSLVRDGMHPSSASG